MIHGFSWRDVGLRVGDRTNIDSLIGGRDGSFVGTFSLWNTTFVRSQ